MLVKGVRMFALKNKITHSKAKEQSNGQHNIATGGVTNTTDDFSFVRTYKIGYD